MNITCIPIAFAIFMTGCAEFSPPTTRDSRLVGDWTCVSANVNGKPVPGETVKALRLTLTDTRYITVKGTETLFDSSYRVDRSADPMRIFMLGNEGSLSGKEALGIYSIKGDTLQICYTMPGYTAPTDFESAPGSKASLITWRRALK